MWLHSISSLIGNSGGRKEIFWVTLLWRIPMGVAWVDEGFEKLKVL